MDEEIEQAREQAKEDVTEEEIEEYQKEGKNPFGQKREQSELNEAVLQRVYSWDVAPKSKGQ